MSCPVYFSSLFSRCTRWKSKPKSLPSLPSGLSYPTIHVQPGPVTSQRVPLTATSKVPAVMVNESNLYSVLDGIFGKGTYEVALDRDVYRIAASRKLTSSERRRFCG
ncbi:hypothetical protein B0H67DRAFT_580456 [Lasiosphaeris hirsuta]|uniref:Uncharacterized protein n=1 Tax=Lasiosphaeris hirsuta TaxID=260670 RepID=A0AA40DT93_9PEZI|nr:hypothetical protein B0H67DRAFT_580456 [Lasiosphaeris hirsuta]